MYGGGSSHPAMRKDLNLPFPTEPDGGGAGHHHHLQQQQQMGHHPGLMKYRSAPSTFLEDFLPNSRSPPHEAAAAAAAAAESMMLAGFMGESYNLGEKERRSTTQFMTCSNSMGDDGREGDDSNSSNHMFHPTQQQLFPNLSCAVASTSTSSTSSDLVRQSSSPSGLFSHHLSAETGGHYRGGLKGQASFSSRPGSAGFMEQISEGEEDTDGRGNGGTGRTRCYIPGYPLASWEDSALLSESFATTGAKRGRNPPDPNTNEFAQNGVGRSHQLSTQQSSLPKSTGSEVGVERFLHFQDAVPCMVRAKRGCATHPRSIAERVRRTKISERMRKLQELVPNMDKQTSTADMLELAMEYIKDLQRSVQELTESKAKCSCSSKRA